MSPTKKLVFAIPFLLILAYFWYSINPLLTSTNYLFSFSQQTLIQLIVITSSLLLASLFFVAFATLAQNWKFIAPVAAIAALLPFLLLTNEFTIFLCAGTFLILILVYAMLDNKLKTYLTFQPIILLHPSVKNTATLMVLLVSIISYFTLGVTAKQQGVTVFDPLIDQSLGIIRQVYGQNQSAQDPDTLAQQQIEQLKQNPSLLAQFGLKPSDLDNPTVQKTLKERLISQNQQAATPTPAQLDLTKTLIQNTLKPYLSFIPAVLAVLVFFTLSTFNAVLSFFTAFLLWALFSLLKETKFIKFETEMREVKKLVV